MQRHMFLRLLAGAGVVTTIFGCVTLITELSALISLITSGILKISTFISVLVLLMPEQFYAVAPLAAAIAIAHGYYEWERHREIVSLRAAGLSNLSLAMPGIAVAAAGLLFTAANSLWLLPVSARIYTDILYDAHNVVAPNALIEGYLQRVDKDLSISFRRRIDDHTIEGVTILDSRTSGGFTYIFADRGYFVRHPGQDPEDVLVLEHGSYYERKSSDANESPVAFNELVVPFDTGASKKRPWSSFWEQYVTSLLDPPASVRAQPVEYGKWIGEGTNRLALPLLCLSYGLFTTGIMLRPWNMRTPGSLRVVLSLSAAAVWYAIMLMIASLIVDSPWIAPLDFPLALLPGAVGAALILIPPRPPRSRRGGASQPVSRPQLQFGSAADRG